jgi:hypothetical protein
MDKKMAELIRVLGIARTRALELGREVVERGGHDTNRAQFLRMVDRAIESAREPVSQGDVVAWRDVFLWKDGKPYYRTANGIPQEIPRALERQIRVLAMGEDNG